MAVLACVLAGTPAASVAAEEEPTTELAAGTAGTARTATARTGAAGSTRAVTYRGLRLDVPADWTVHDLAAAPETCVRFDRPALYLGTPGADQRCPARAVGRAHGLVVEPASADKQARPAGLGASSLAAAGGMDASGEASYALTGTGLTVTAAYGERSDVVASVLASARYEGPARTTPFAAVAPTLADAPSIPPGRSSARYSGRGFDTCAAPSTATMRAWLASSYRMVGIYIGGVNRACPDGNLSRAWIEANARSGWRMLPIYVGRQAPCAFQGDLGPIRPTNVAQQGAEAARDAIIRAQRFGLLEGSALYYDMESYDTRDAACRTIVLTFLSAWTKRLHDSGYLSGVYSSAASGIRDLSNAYNSGTYVRPDAIWFARWNNVASVWGEPYAPNAQWGSHQRVKQFRGPHTETWGGRRVEIDSNVVNGPLSSVRFAHRVISRTGLHARSGPSTASPSVRVWAPGSTLSVVCQIWASPVGTTRIWDKLVGGGYVSDLHVSTSSKRTFSPPIPKCRLPYAVNTDVLQVRAGPSAAYRVLGTIRRGGLAYIVCQRRGQLVGNSAVWDKLDSGGWIADYYTVTPGRPGYSSPIPRCV